jgi:hypothetical protein
VAAAGAELEKLSKKSIEASNLAIAPARVRLLKADRSLVDIVFIIITKNTVI